jgi:hypothetical protein
MHALKAEFELSNNLHVFARASAGECHRFEIAREREVHTTTKSYENRGNEAKKCLKTKDLTIFNGASSAHFARNLSAIEPQMDQTTPGFTKTGSRLTTPTRYYDTDKQSASQPRDSHKRRLNLDSGWQGRKTWVAHTSRRTLAGCMRPLNRGADMPNYGTSAPPAKIDHPLPLLIQGGEFLADSPPRTRRGGGWCEVATLASNQCPGNKIEGTKPECI